MESLLADIPMSLSSRYSLTMGSPGLRVGSIYNPQDAVRTLSDLQTFITSQEMVITSLSAKKDMQEEVDSQKQEILKL